MPHHDKFTSVDPRTAQPRPSGYSATAKTLHWLIVLLVLAQFVVVFLMPSIGRDTVLEPLITRHFSIGVLILVVMAFRWMLRLHHPVPLDTPGLAAWERWLAYATHRLFYFILLIGPFLGWASASAHSLSVNIFGVIPLPSIAAPKASWALTAGDIHTVMMWTLLALIGLHVAAALTHHYFRHDDVLRRMLPGGGTRRP
ncbi:cytochrome b [Alcaligenaceae bacterium CGII-47]|nr:cytochrome b [Alcaligenaceae bacterium CGII-47]